MPRYNYNYCEIISENLSAGNHNSIIPEFKNPDYCAGKLMVKIITFQPGVNIFYLLSP